MFDEYPDRCNCFNGNHAPSVFYAHGQRCREAISSLSSEKMDQTDREAWVDYFVSEYEIDMLDIHPEAMELEIKEKTIQVYNQWSRMIPYENEYIDQPGVRATCRVPFYGDPSLFELTPSTHTFSSFVADRVVKPGRDGVGYLVLSFELTQDDAEPNVIREHFENEIAAFIQEAERVNSDARVFNQSLPALVEEAVDNRTRQLDKLASIRQGLNIPLNRVKGAPLAKPIPLKKKKLTFSEPKPSRETSPTYSIADADFCQITEIIDNLCSVMEAAPGSYCTFEEEQLRDHLLSVLNTHYENATGETFRNHGKTDIFIPFENHAAYIAECKCWHGKKKFGDAIDQLFSYTTWRDTKVSIIVFNKSVKNFDTVLAAIEAELDERASCVEREKHTCWKCSIQGDDERLMRVNVQAFNLFYQPS